MRTKTVGLLIAALAVIALTVGNPPPVTPRAISGGTTAALIAERGPGGLPASVETSTAGLQAEDIRFRKEFGLDADPARVAALYGGVARDQLDDARQPYGVLLTSEERAEVDERFARVDDVTELRRRAEAESPSTFAGLYTDQAAGGEVVISYTREAAAKVDRVKGGFSRPELVRPRDVRYTLQALEAAQAELSADIRALAAEGIDVTSVRLSVRNNAVEVGMSDFSARRAAELRVRYGAMLDVSEAGAPRTTSRANSYPPMKGGLEIYRDIDANTIAICSSGFMGKRDVQGVPPLGLTQTLEYVISAGHCGINGQRWFHFIAAWGTMRDRRFFDGGTFDGSIIQLDRTSDRSNQVFMDDSQLPPYYHSITSMQALGADNEGDPITMSARTSGIRSGTILSTNVSINYTADAVILNNQLEASFDSQGGDSGGPVFRPSTSRAIGIVSGSFDTTNNAVFSHISRIANGLNVQVRTTS